MHESAAMKSMAPKPPAPSMGDLLEDALRQARTLVEAEFSLARAELKQELKRALGSALLLAAGAMFLQAALVTLGVLLVLALGASIASGVIVLALACIATSLLLIGVRAVRQEKLPRTTARLSTDAKQVLETVK